MAPKTEKINEEFIESILDEFVKSRLNEPEETWFEVCDFHLKIELTTKEAEEGVSMAIKKTREQYNKQIKKVLQEDFCPTCRKITIDGGLTGFCKICGLPKNQITKEELSKLFDIKGGGV